MSLEDKFHVVADGFSEIEATDYTSEIFPVSAEQRAFLDNFTAEQIVKSKKTGGTFYDGDLVGVKMGSMRVKEGRLAFGLQKIKYSQHAGIFRGKHDSPIQALYVNGLVLTKDNYLVLGVTQIAESGNVGKVGLSAGAVEEKDQVGGKISLETAIAREMNEELGLEHKRHYEGMVPGWMNGASQREKNYHLTTSFVVPVRMTAEEMTKYFNDWKKEQEKAGKKTEFKGIALLENSTDKIKAFIAEQDSLGSKAKLLGKSLDVLEVWAEKYGCNPDNLVDSYKQGARVYLPQPKLF